MPSDFQSSLSSAPSVSPENDHPTVVLIDDDPGARESMRALVTSQGWKCSTYESAEHYLEDSPPPHPACLIIDYKLPGIDGLELQARLTQQEDRFPVIVVTGHADVSSAVKFMEGEAVTLLQKPSPPEQLVETIRLALDIDRQRTQLRERFERIAKVVDQLSQRERTVLEGVVAGKLNKVVAKELGVSIRTVEGDRARIVDRFGVTTVNEVVAEFSQLNLLYELCMSQAVVRGHSRPSWQPLIAGLNPQNLLGGVKPTGETASDLAGEN